jgi:hypothetical protein
VLVFNKVRYILIFFIIFALSSVVYADIYKYVDRNGVICYTDSPLDRKANRIHKDTPDSAGLQPQTLRNNTKQDTDYHRIVSEKAVNYNLDPSLIKAVIQTESNWNDHAVSNKGAMGLMQLMPSTANDLNVRNPFDPEENIEGGTKYLKYLLERFNGDLTLALAAYNAGPKTVERFGCVPPISETRQYVKKVLARYNGRTYFPAVNDSEGNEKKNEVIYKIVMDDGTVLFTNSSLFPKSSTRSNAL